MKINQLIILIGLLLQVACNGDSRKLLGNQIEIEYDKNDLQQIPATNRGVWLLEAESEVIVLRARIMKDERIELVYKIFDINARMTRKGRTFALFDQVHGVYEDALIAEYRFPIAVDSVPSIGVPSNEFKVIYIPISDENKIRIKKNPK